jgi:hypothetical protein
MFIRRKSTSLGQSAGKRRSALQRPAWHLYPPQLNLYGAVDSGIRQSSTNHVTKARKNLRNLSWHPNGACACDSTLHFPRVISHPYHNRRRHEVHLISSPLRRTLSSPQKCLRLPTVTVNRPWPGLSNIYNNPTCYNNINKRSNTTCNSTAQPFLHP